MKRNLFIALVWLLCCGCALQGAEQMNPQDQESAKKEIGEVVGVIFQSLEKMDVEALFRSYSDACGFILINTEGVMINLPMARFGHAEWFKSLSSLKITPFKEEFRFPPGNIVLCAWQGKFEMTMKTGAQLAIDKFGVTFVFSRIDGLWQVIYQHSSSLPPLPLKP